MARRRLDEELVSQGLFRTTDDALRSIMAGDVSGDGRRFSSPGQLVRTGETLHVRGHIPFVSRGGIKLAAGLDAFGVDPAGLDCLDVGCSTGGFTDCLLSRGARSVMAVDVGYAQFDWSLRGDPRVSLRERTNVCDLPSPDNVATIDLAVCDVSFTSVTVVLPAVCALLKDDGNFLTLVKPQFEADRSDVGEGGVVRDDAVRAGAVERVMAAFSDAGLGCRGLCASPITGHKGNHEYLLLGTRGLSSLPLDVASVVRGSSAR